MLVIHPNHVIFVVIYMSMTVILVETIMEEPDLDHIYREIERNSWSEQEANSTTSSSFFQEQTSHGKPPKAVSEDTVPIEKSLYDEGLDDEDKLGDEETAEDIDVDNEFGTIRESTNGMPKKSLLLS